ncbi:hypothetical protein CCP3SC1AL1_1060010 [Gammaproteobacteria bacterium]
MFRQKDAAMLVTLVLAVALFAWVQGGATASSTLVPTEETVLTSLAVQPPQSVPPEQNATHDLEKRLQIAEREIETLRKQNIDLQEAKDIAQEDIGRMRVEMSGCAGDRAHLDDVSARYQSSQAQLFYFHQRLHRTEKYLSSLQQERDDLLDSNQWFRERLSLTKRDRNSE